MISSSIGQAPAQTQIQPQVSAVSIQSSNTHLSATPKVDVHEQDTLRGAFSRSRIGSDDNVHTLCQTPTMRRTVSLKHSLNELPTADRFSQSPPESNTFLLHTLGSVNI